MNTFKRKSNLNKKAKEINKHDQVNENKIFKNENKHFKNKIQSINFIYIFELIIIINLFIVILPIKKSRFLESKNSYITLKIPGIGYKNIFSNNTAKFKQKYYPKEIYINEEKQNVVNYTYYFNRTDNNIKLIWNYLIDIFFI